MNIEHISIVYMTDFWPSAINNAECISLVNLVHALDPVSLM